MRTAAARDSKLARAREAVQQIQDSSTLAVLGAGGGILEPDLLLHALGERYRETGHPRELTLVHSTGLGDRRGRGTEPLAAPGLLRRVIAGHFGMCPQVAALVESNQIEGYNVPLGVLSLLMREIAGGRQGVLTEIGLGVYADPRNEGCRMNEITPPDLVELVEIDGRELLLYRSFPIHAALIRGSYGDAAGYLSLEEETSYLDAYEIAAATRASGGAVIAQVKSVVEIGSLCPKHTVVPGILVDAVVEHRQQWQTYDHEYVPAFAGRIRTRVPPQRSSLGHRQVIARRAALEVSEGDVLNLGVGIPAGIAEVLEQDGASDAVTCTIEHGVVGGVTAPGVIFGATTNARAVISMPSMIDFYHGGGLDIAFLGFAQFDGEGNVNVSRFGGTVMGAGGFVDITQPTSCVVFCGTLTAGGLEVSFDDGAFELRREGAMRKAPRRVDQVTFSGRRAIETGQRVLFVTERALFELTEHGLALREVAPGVDVEAHVLPLCDFNLLAPDEVGRFEPAVISDGPLGLRERWGSTRSTGSADGEPSKLVAGRLQCTSTNGGTI